MTPDAQKVETALRKALSYMETLQRNGGWAMCWTEDLKYTYGEFRIRPFDIITVQPPATPGCGGAFLRAYQILNDQEYLERACAAGDALIAGQLDCGGFPHEFTPGSSKKGSGTFDDNVTQGASRFFVELWRVSGEERYKKAALRCAQFILDSQYENGGFPQAYPLQKGYSQYITLNDRAMMDAIRTLYFFYEAFGDERYEQAARRGADCLLDLQGKPPQAGWAQQFTAQGEPAPARRFEPVALVTAESMDALRLLLEVYLKTGDKKYLKAGPPAFAWMKQSRLPNGRWARFYEYGSNRPIYSTADGTIVFDVNQARPGYGWQGNYYSPDLEKQYETFLQASPEKRRELEKKSKTPSRETLSKRAQTAMNRMDNQGRWLSPMRGSVKTFYQEKEGEGKNISILHSGMFVSNANALLDFLDPSTGKESTEK